MNAVQLRDFLFACTVINFGFLLLWAVGYRLARGMIRTIWRGWFDVPDQTMDAANLFGIIVYKSLVVVFNLVPLLALVFTS